MLVFTLLTSLFLHTPAASAKDTLQPQRSRPSVGIVFTTAPRAYQIQNNLGLSLSFPIDNKGMYEMFLTLGGNIYYTETGLRAIYDTSSSTPVVGIPITYKKSYSLMGSIGIRRRWSLARKTSLLTGLQLGFSRINYSEVYKTTPVTRQRFGWVNDSTPTAEYEYVKSFNNTHTCWLALSLGIRQQLTRNWHLEMTAQLGPRIRVEKLYGTGERFVTVKPYSGYFDGKLDPYNPVWEFQTQGVQSPLAPNKPLINSFEPWGFSSVQVVVSYRL